MNCKKGVWGLRPQAGGIAPSTPTSIFYLIAPTYLDISLGDF